MIEVEPSAATVPAFILMEASVIAHAIKEVQMLSGSAHIVISQRNTSLIFVVFFNFSSPPPSHFARRRASWKLCGIENDKEMNFPDSRQMFPVQHSN